MLYVVDFAGDGIFTLGYTDCATDYIPISINHTAESDGGRKLFREI